MVCREIINCPLVHRLRGELELVRILYCETSSEPCALRPLLVEGKEVPPTLLPDGNQRQLSGEAGPCMVQNAWHLPVAKPVA